MPTLALSAPNSTIVVTYFHTRNRCLPCVRLEKLTETTVTTRFARQVRERRVLWRRVDVDEPHQRHFLRDYGLHTKSVVISEVRGGFEVRWKNLDRVWQLLEDPEAFKTYVEQEVRGFLRQG